MDIKIILDIILGFLLVGTSFYLWMLNKRLSVLRKNRDEMARLIAQFNEATVRADTSIPKLRKAAEDAGQALQDRVEKAQALRDDLAFMIERADSMADRLEQAVRTGRSEMKAVPRPAATAPAPSSGLGMGLGSAAAAGPAAVTSTSSGNAASMAAANTTFGGKTAGGKGASDTSSGNSTSPLASPAAQAAITAALQSVKNVAAASRSSAEPAGLPPGVDEEERSEAERELLRALQSVR